MANECCEQVQQEDEEIARLKDEVNILKGEKKQPAFKGGKLDKNAPPESSSVKEPKKRASSRKRQKTQQLVIHEDKIINPLMPSRQIPASKVIVTLLNDIGVLGRQEEVS